MNKTRWFLALAILVMATLACNAVTGGGQSAPPATGSGGDGITAPTDESDSSGGNESNGASEYPLPDSVSGLTTISGTTNFQTDLSLDEAMAFYRDALTQEGYTERTALTSTSDTTFSMVFDGHPSGKAIVVQAVDLGSQTNISIRLEDVP